MYKTTQTRHHKYDDIVGWVQPFMIWTCAYLIGIQTSSPSGDGNTPGLHCQSIKWVQMVRIVCRYTISKFQFRQYLSNSRSHARWVKDPTLTTNDGSIPCVGAVWINVKARARPVFEMMKGEKTGPCEISSDSACRKKKKSKTTNLYLT